MLEELMSQKPQAFEERKFRELLLYIAKKSQDDENFGDTKLNKLLFHSERRSFVRLGRSITGQRFQKQKFGQTSIHLVPNRREMIEAGDCELVPVPRGTKTQGRTRALREPALAAFSKDELQIVDEVIKENWNKTASQMSREAKDDVCWRAARSLGDEVHLASLVFKRRPLTKEETDFARRARAELNGGKSSSKG